MILAVVLILNFPRLPASSISWEVQSILTTVNQCGDVHFRTFIFEHLQNFTSDKHPEANALLQ